MGHRFCQGVRNYGSNEENIRAPDCGEGIERFSGTTMSVGGCEGVLIVGLNDVMGFCNGWAQAMCEGNFGIGQMAQDVANRPFFGGRFRLQFFVWLGTDQLPQAFRRRSDYSERIFLLQIARIRI
jgi:hypothetical protein